MDLQSTASKEDVFDYYGAPTETLQPEHILAEEKARESIDALFWSWERLRIVYNATLFVVVLLLGFRRLIAGDEGFYVTCAIGAFLANVCYCTGFPLIVYARRLGIKGRSTMPVLFALGLLLSVGLTALVCLLQAKG